MEIKNEDDHQRHERPKRNQSPRQDCGNTHNDTDAYQNSSHNSAKEAEINVEF